MELERHRLVWLADAGWRELLPQAPDPASRQCLAHWAREHLPLVVTRQSPDDALIAVGLAMPTRWERRKLALRVAHQHLLYSGAFPAAADIAPLLSTAARLPWRTLCAELSLLGVSPRVHGSHGWQKLTGLRYLHAASDIDLHISVDNDLLADRVATLLQLGTGSGGPRIDGELLFPDGGAIAWREWLQLREGRVREVLVKRLGGVALEAL
ncbi:MAG: malonate decarboxylase holo-[acyl-carrier-protein] synthase [Burkholderiales bacterium]|nr:malonate decarboxylase holo-[acyl-carrier-protein] synthase [Burkholderiales bacterium]